MHCGWAILVMAATAVMMPCRTNAGGAAVEAWRTSPFHGAISGGTGQPIPCLCRFRGRDFKVGETVCMQTQNGIVLTRCDLFLNNTTWVPSDEPCTLSRAPTAPHQSRKS